MIPEEDINASNEYPYDAFTEDNPVQVAPI